MILCVKQIFRRDWLNLLVSITMIQVKEVTYFTILNKIRFYLK